MPKAEIPVGSVRAVMHGSLGPAEWVNVRYYVGTFGGHTPGDVIAAVAQAEHDLYHNGMGLSAFPTVWSTQYCTVLYRDTSSSVVRVRVADVQAGTDNSGLQDAQVSYLINWSTGDPRRGGKPRSYIPGVIDAFLQDSAFLLPATVLNKSTLLTTWLTGLPARAIPLQLVEMSFVDHKADRVTPVTYPIIGAALNPVVATQRRRVDRLRPT
jgi:hypothetical protein